VRAWCISSDGSSGESTLHYWRVTFEVVIHREDSIETSTGRSACGLRPVIGTYYCPKFTFTPRSSPWSNVYRHVNDKATPFCVFDRIGATLIVIRRGAS
jgi:hypothetical protein